MHHSPKAKSKPTPRPAKNLPAVKRGIWTKIICIKTPTLKTQLDMMRPHRRPSLSASKGEAKAPKKVPNERIDTMREDCVGLMVRCPSTSVYPVEKFRCQYFMAMMPPMVPVS